MAPCLFLNIFQSVELKYPSVVASDFEICNVLSVVKSPPPLKGAFVTIVLPEFTASVIP